MVQYRSILRYREERLSRMEKQPTSSNRRDFIKTAGAAAGTALSLGFPAIISAQTVTNALKVGLIGCGGRGTGAASQALHADGYAELTAVGDVFQPQIDAALAELAEHQNRRPRQS